MYLVLSIIDYEGGWIRGVYTSKKRAEEHLAKLTHHEGDENKVVKVPVNTVIEEEI